MFKIIAIVTGLAFLIFETVPSPRLMPHRSTDFVRFKLEVADTLDRIAHTAETAAKATQTINDSLGALLNSGDYEIFSYSLGVETFSTPKLNVSLDYAASDYAVYVDIQYGNETKAGSYPLAFNVYHLASTGTYYVSTGVGERIQGQTSLSPFDEFPSLKNVDWRLIDWPGTH